jgi:hypothetical protein
MNCWIKKEMMLSDGGKKLDHEICSGMLTGTGYRRINGFLSCNSIHPQGNGGTDEKRKNDDLQKSMERISEQNPGVYWLYAHNTC